MWKRFILWDYPRGSRPYDVMVGIILAFIFLTPRELFRDQPRIPNAGSIVMLPSENGSSSSFFVHADVLASIPENLRASRLALLLQARTGHRHLGVTRVEPMMDSEGGLLGYVAFTTP